MERAIKESERRRKIQLTYNQKHRILPQSISKKIYGVIEATSKVAESESIYQIKPKTGKLTKKELKQTIARLEKEMREASRKLEFEKAAGLRDLLIELRLELRGKDSRLISQAQ